MIKEQPSDPWGFIASQLPEEVLKNALENLNSCQQPAPVSAKQPAKPAHAGIIETDKHSAPGKTVTKQSGVFPQLRARAAESLRRAARSGELGHALQSSSRPGSSAMADSNETRLFPSQRGLADKRSKLGNRLSRAVNSG